MASQIRKFWEKKLTTSLTVNSIIGGLFTIDLKVKKVTVRKRLRKNVRWSFADLTTMFTTSICSKDIQVFFGLFIIFEVFQFMPSPNLWFIQVQETKAPSSTPVYAGSNQVLRNLGIVGRCKAFSYVCLRKSKRSLTSREVTCVIGYLITRN